MTSRNLLLKILIIVSAAFGAVLIHASSAHASPAQVRGTVTYRERIALSSSAVVLVRIESTGRSLVAETRFTTGGKQVPLPYLLQYLTEAASSGDKYVIRASIIENGRTSFSSEMPFTPNGSKIINFVLNRPNQNGQILRGEWQLFTLNGKPVQSTGTGAPYIAFLANGKLIGDTGVNRFSGTYTSSENRITLNPGATTLKGGTPAMMTQESTFLDVLKSATNWQMNGVYLKLLNGSRVTARFIHPRQL